MSRIEATLGKDAPLLQSKKLFGEIPPLEGSANKPKRLSDQIELIRESAYEQGYKAGFDNGTLIGQAEGRKTGFQKAITEVEAERVIEVAKFLADLEVFRLEFEAAAAEWAIQTEQIVTDLSMIVVERILAPELATNHETALGICREVLDTITHAKQARILINPKDYALFESHREEIIKQSRELNCVDIIEDHNVKSGVMIQTESGTIDATVETRLELFTNEFNKAA